MDFRDHSVEDFVLNKRFRKWILNPQKEDSLYWEDYLRKHPEQVPLIAEAKKLLQKMPDVRDTISGNEKDELWARITDNLQKGREAGGKVYPMNAESVIGKAIHEKRKTSKTFYLKRIVVAASLLLFLTISWSLYQSIFENQIVETDASDEMISKQNPWGQKSTVFLSDGSEVVLNSGSTLRYQKEFDGDERKVFLEGEAFFNVAKDLRRPFIVISGSIATTALGTSFNVRAFPAQSSLVVSLVTGKVKVAETGSTQANEVILEPGEQASYVGIKKEIRKEKFSPYEVTSWKDGIIYFQDADSKEVFDYLERWYGVTIREENQPVKKWNYTGEFKNMDLHNVLSSVGFTMNFDFEKNDKLITIRYLNE